MNTYLSRRSIKPNTGHIPITSALLDELMSSSNDKGPVKSPENNQPDISRSNCKRSFINENTTMRLTSSLQFTPPQINKARKTVQNCKKSTLSEVEDQDLSVTTSSTSKTSGSSTIHPRIKICFDETSDTSSKARNSAESGRDSYRSPIMPLYITPESTPKTSPEVIRSRHKRSLSDQYEDSHSTPYSVCVNSSAYYTPDSSPGEYCSSVKRLKTRWSETLDPCRNGDTGYLNGRLTNPLRSSDKSVYEPELIGYQMIGDSQFCRFGQQLLGLQRVPTPNSPGRIGICVSGQTITDLHRRVKENFYPISDKIILMIGTNDFLRNIDVTTMCKELSALLTTLQETVTNIVLLTLPPIPKLERKQNTRHFALLDVYNNYIRSLENGDSLRVADVSPLYMSPPPYQKCRMDLFELFFHGPIRRHDLIHLNRQGLEVIRKYILDNFL